MLGLVRMRPEFPSGLNPQLRSGRVQNMAFLSKASPAIRTIQRLDQRDCTIANVTGGPHLGFPAARLVEACAAAEMHNKI